MNLPAGMSELDLINYSPVLYELYRNEGQGFDNDAFRYDPVVSTGMLASDYELAKGLAWVNLLTPESQGAINPGDNLIVPVQTFDNYKNLPPWEKRLSHEVSYTGKNLESKYSANLLNLQASQVGMKNNFVGDFSYYFDNESRLLGMERAALSLATEIPAPAPIEVPTTPKTIVISPLPPKPNPIIEQMPVPSVPVKPRIEQMPIPVKPRIIIATQEDTTPGLVATTTTTTTPTEEIISGGYLPSGGGMSMGGGAEMPEDAPETETTTETNSETANGSSDTKKVTKDCEINYIPVIIGFVVLAIIGYAIAKQKKKDIKKFSIAGAVIGGLLGYVYAKHQCVPVEALSKIGIKSKTESNYYGGR